MTAAWGRGLATITDDGAVLDTWYREVGLGVHWGTTVGDEPA